MEPLGDWPSIAPWKSRHTVLILTGGVLRSENTLTGKRAMVSGPYPDGATIVAVWSSQWATTARLVTEDDYPRLRQALNG